MKKLFGKTFSRKKKKDLASSRGEVDSSPNPNIHAPNNVHDEEMHDDPLEMRTSNPRASSVGRREPIVEASTCPSIHRGPQITSDPDPHTEEYYNVTAPDPSYYSHVDMLFSNDPSLQDYEIAFGPSMGAYGGSSSSHGNPPPSTSEHIGGSGYSNVPPEYAGMYSNLPSGNMDTDFPPEGAGGYTYPDPSSENVREYTPVDAGLFSEVLLPIPDTAGFRCGWMGMVEFWNFLSPEATQRVNEMGFAEFASLRFRPTNKGFVDALVERFRQPPILSSSRARS